MCTATHRPRRPNPFDLHGQLLQLLMRLHPDHLSGRRLGSRHLALEQPRDGARAEILQALGVDPELSDLLPHHGIAGEHATVLLHAPRQLDEPIERNPQPDL